ncbi:unnamed protein product [Acanthoscelides obtectus]|uniref:Uncharacterized protein n=1 Tax=Acanthoscelides obtectus TaxID=200917 RepID=A0A9P0K0C6_ACAOB|nr:unnamed protein product [Acanthoscelides obtectus]CAK1658492.1 hypothetical protein AOBTE_LOCUS20934 [Acanthoscelides obtectus]
MNPNIAPHKFACQLDRQLSCTRRVFSEKGQGRKTSRHAGRDPKPESPSLNAWKLLRRSMMNCLNL